MRVSESGIHSYVAVAFAYLAWAITQVHVYKRDPEAWAHLWRAASAPKAACSSCGELVVIRAGVMRCWSCSHCFTASQDELRAAGLAL